MLEIGRSQQRAIRISFAAGVIILLFKFVAYYATNSAALLSDALESIINVIASAFAMWSIHLAKTPPDANHPYGHGKVEYFSALLEGVLIIIAAGCILYTAFPKILEPEELTRLDYGLLVSVVASAMNLALGLFLIRQGRSTNSITLVADGKHVLTDVYTTAGVLIGLAVVLLTNWLWMDGLIACIVAINILWTGYGLARESVKGLMNEADHTLVKEICTLLNSNRRSEWISVHKLRAWRAGRFIHIDFHLVLPKQLSFEEAHSVVADLESLFGRKYDGVAEVMIRTDMCDYDFCSMCYYEKCKEVGAKTPQNPWDEQVLCSDFNK
ncbi:cation diffusion facilitator family transporter [Fundidesulfovibrio putealis]|uniref:cation diffusion facilitator family transporter n=1 Tax=Fundidesulfovibrio putealis TaxID=270496 RepID=UPI000A06FF08|nr:cation diffusion facilitator family transporter [Fundidesulfovibrio putealis]